METTDKSGISAGRDNNLCRTCLAVDQDNQCIFDHHNNDLQKKIDSTSELWERLQLYGGIEVSQNDDFPGIMCNTCISKMDIAHEFRMQCQASDKILRSIYTKKNESSSWLKIFKDDVQRLQASVNESNKPQKIYNNKKRSLNENLKISRAQSVSTIEISQTRKDLKAGVGNQCKSNEKSKKQECRSQRLILFKRATSLTNLKNNKERQRQYIKKSFHATADNAQRGSNVSPKRSPVCNSTIKPDSYETNLKNLSDKLVRLEGSLNEEKVQDDLLPGCKICNKNFRKASTMVRHLNVHKRDNPRAVYFILRDMRERRRRKNLMSLRKGCGSVENFGSPKEDKLGEKLIFENCKKGSNGTREEVDDRSALKVINMWIKEELDSDPEGKGFPCENCGKSYASSKSLCKHRLKMHGDFLGDEKLSFTCGECNKIFLKEAKLEKHLRIHARAKEQQDANFKRFLCHICSKTFRQNTGLMFHMRTHTGYKPHVCKYCGRGFTSNSNCINHERTHTGDRPFVCHFCSAAFAKSCTLKAHITTHTGEANYHCKTCGKSFRRLKYLKEHRFTHTGEKPYACKICGTAYSHSGSLFVHEKKCKAQENNQNNPRDSNSSNSQLIGLIHQLDPAKCYAQRFDSHLSQTANHLTPVCARLDGPDTPSDGVRNFCVGEIFQT